MEPARRRVGCGLMSALLDIKDDTPTAVYRFRDVGKSLLYIGITDDPEARFKNHASTKSWWPEVVGKQVEWHPSRSIADGHETVAIASEQPRYNRKKRRRPSLGVRRGLVTLEYTCEGVGAPGYVAEILGIPGGELVLKQVELFSLDGHPAILLYKWTRVISPPRVIETWAARSNLEITRSLDTHEQWMLMLAYYEQVQHAARVVLSPAGTPYCLWEDMRPEWFSRAPSVAAARLDPRSPWYTRRLPTIPLPVACEQTWR